MVGTEGRRWRLEREGEGEGERDGGTRGEEMEREGEGEKCG